MKLDFPITAALIGLALILSASLWLGAPPAWAMADATQLADGQLWRLVTGPLVHSDYGQAGRDLSMMLLVGRVWEQPLGPRFVPLLLCCLAVPTAVATTTHFELGTYFGLSGAVNGLFTAALVVDFRRTRSKLVLALLAFHAVKLGYEVWSGTGLLPMELASGVTPLPEAHVAGALTGLLLALVLWPRRCSPPKLDDIATTRSPNGRAVVTTKRTRSSKSSPSVSTRRIRRSSGRSR
jgi:rhomboid family GlyGly-CTERM serine protease